MTAKQAFSLGAAFPGAQELSSSPQHRLSENPDQSAIICARFNNCTSALQTVFLLHRTTLAHHERFENLCKNTLFRPAGRAARADFQICYLHKGKPMAQGFLAASLRCCHKRAMTAASSVVCVVKFLPALSSPTRIYLRNCTSRLTLLWISSDLGCICDASSGLGKN